MKKTWKRLCTGFLALATVVTALPTTPVHAESKQYWTESAERVGIIEKVMNDGSIGSTFNEGYMKVEGETAYCIDINTDFKNGYKTRADASSRMSADQISDVALSLEYVKQYGEAHKELNYKQVYLLEQCVVWQRLSVHLGWQCDNVRASYDEIPKATQDEVFAGAKAFVKENKGRYKCGGYMEFQGNAIKKMYMLPFKTSSIFKNKFYILFVLLTFCIVLQNGALCIIGNIFLPNGTFELLTLVKYTGYCFVSSLPVLAFMLLVSSRCENIWFTLGIGVAGFFSGMAMSLSDISLFLVNPFVLMMKPAVASTASIDTGILILGVFETIIFFMIGWYLCKIKHYE